MLQGLPGGLPACRKCHLICGGAGFASHLPASGDPDAGSRLRRSCGTSLFFKIDLSVFLALADTALLVIEGGGLRACGERRETLLGGCAASTARCVQRRGL